MLPAGFLYILCQPLSVIRNPKFKAVWGELYEGLKESDKARLAFHLMYTLRRIIYCFIAFSFSDYTIFQVQLLLFQNIANIIYIGYF